jgi:hypothetical protein
MNFAATAWAGHLLVRRSRSHPPFLGESRLKLAADITVYGQLNLLPFVKLKHSAE